MTDLHHERAVAAELENHPVAFARTGEPHEAFGVDGNAVLGCRPVVAGVRTAPCLHEIAGLIEFHHRRRRCATDGARRRQGCAAFVLGERTRPLEHPDVIAVVGEDAADLTQKPVIRQRLRPRRVDGELRNALRTGARASIAAKAARRKSRRTNMIPLSRMTTGGCGARVAGFSANERDVRHACTVAMSPGKEQFILPGAARLNAACCKGAGGRRHNLAVGALVRPRQASSNAIAAPIDLGVQLNVRRPHREVAT